jgi:hypothetical protein
VHDLLHLTTDPRVKKRLLKTETDEEGRISPSEILAVMSRELSTKKKLKLGVVMGGVLVLLVLLLLGANAALTFSMVALSKDSSVQSSGVLTAKDGGGVVGTATSAAMVNLLYAHHTTQESAAALLAMKSLVVNTNTSAGDTSTFVYQVLAATLVPALHLELVVTARSAAAAALDVSKLMRIYIDDKGVHEVRGGDDQGTAAAGRRLLLDAGAGVGSVQGMVSDMATNMCGESWGGAAVAACGLSVCVCVCVCVCKNVNMWVRVRCHCPSWTLVCSCGSRWPFSEDWPQYALGAEQECNPCHMAPHSPPPALLTSLHPLAPAGPSTSPCSPITTQMSCPAVQTCGMDGLPYASPCAARSAGTVVRCTNCPLMCTTSTATAGPDQQGQQQEQQAAAEVTAVNKAAVGTAAVDTAAVDQAAAAAEQARTEQQQEGQGGIGLEEPPQFVPVDVGVTNTLDASLRFSVMSWAADTAWVPALQGFRISLLQETAVAGQYLPIPGWAHRELVTKLDAAHPTLPPRLQVSASTDGSQKTYYRLDAVLKGPFPTSTRGGGSRVRFEVASVWLDGTVSRPVTVESTGGRR